MGLFDVIKKAAIGATDFFAGDGAMEDQLLQNDMNDDRNFIRDATAMDKAKDNRVNAQDCNAHSHERNEQVRQQSFKVIEKSLTGSEPQQCSDLHTDDSEVNTGNTRIEEFSNECGNTEDNFHNENEHVCNADASTSNNNNGYATYQEQYCSKPDKSPECHTTYENPTKREPESEDYDSCNSAVNHNCGVEPKDRDAKAGGREKSISIENNTQSDIQDTNKAEDSVEKKVNVIKNNNNYHLLGKEDKTQVRLSEVDGRYVIDSISGTFKQVPYMPSSVYENSYHKTDLIADIAKIENIFVFGYSMRGESHFAHHEPRQDYFVIDSCKSKRGKDYLIAVVADGVGNSSEADKFAEYIANYTSLELKDLLMEKERESVLWDAFASNIWEVSVRYCYEKSNHDNDNDQDIDINAYVQKWATTLELLIVECNKTDANDFTHVTIAGDGGCYIINDKNKWGAVKEGKVRDNTVISNAVNCLPYKPESIVVQEGILRRNEMLFIVTDGFGDFIEDSSEVRAFFGSRLLKVNNISEYIRILNVAVKGMDDDKTGVLIKYY